MDRKVSSPEFFFFFLGYRFDLSFSIRKLEYLYLQINLRLFGVKKECISFFFIALRYLI